MTRRFGKYIFELEKAREIGDQLEENPQQHDENEQNFVHHQEKKLALDIFPAEIWEIVATFCKVEEKIALRHSSFDIMKSIEEISWKNFNINQS